MARRVDDYPQISRLSDPFLTVQRASASQQSSTAGSLANLARQITSAREANRCRWSGFTLLHRAAGLGDTAICQILLDKGANINSTSSLGWYTPLHIALANGYLDTAAFLINNGANYKMRSKYGEDCFDYGSKRGFKRATEEFRARTMKIELSKKFQQQMELMKSASAANSSSYDSVMRVEAVENIDKLNNSCSYDLVEEEDAKK